MDFLYNQDYNNINLEFYQDKILQLEAEIGNLRQQVEYLQLEGQSLRQMIYYQGQEALERIVTNELGE